MRDNPLVKTDKATKEAIEEIIKNSPPKSLDELIKEEETA